MDDTVAGVGGHRRTQERGLRDRLWAPTRLWARPRRFRVFATTSGAPRARRASDLFLLIAALAGLAVAADAADPPSDFEQALQALATDIPRFLDILWRVPAHLFLGWALVLLVAAVVKRRLALGRDIVVVAAVAAVGAQVLDDAVLGDLATDTGIWAQVVDLEPPGVAVSVPLAVAVAVGTLCSPHLTQPMRSLGRWLAALGTVGFVVLGATAPTGAAVAVLVGVAAAAATHLAVGSGGGSPSLTDVRTALDDLDVETGPLTEAQRQRAGVYQVDTVDAAGTPMLIKVYGRDARDTQALARAWRALWYRDREVGSVTRLQQAEHEALVTLVAERADVAVDEVVRAGRSDDGDAVLVLRQTTATDHAIDADRQVDQMWDAVSALHRAGLTHGELAPDRFRPGPDRAVVTGLAAAQVTTTEDQRNLDLAQLVVSTALVAGTADAADVAARRLGPDGSEAVLPYLQVAGLGRDLRADLRASSLDVDELRAAVADAAGVDEPAMAKLRRVTKGGLVRAGLLALVAYFLITSLSGIDLAELVDQLRAATWELLVLALMLGQTPRFAQAEATRGACPRPMAYGPLVLLQFGISFVNLAIPSTAARVAVNIRFFQRQGIPPASAVSIGVIDSLGGFVVQIAILVSVLVLGAGQVDLDLQRTTDGPSEALVVGLVVAAALVVVAAVVAAAVPKVRARVVARVRPWLHEVRETVSSLRSPTKLAQVLGGNLVAEILFASTLGLVALAYGEHVPLGTLLAINVGVSLFAGLMPVPGGIGVAEGALTVGLTAAGLDQATALAIAMSYRLVTYYLPPIWGAVAFHRLERTGFI